MPLGISSHLFFTERLGPAHLDTLLRAGAESIEIFASRHHFNYAHRNTVRELALWFSSNPLLATMHMPIYTESEERDWSRHAEPTLNLVSASKRDRIAAMDEVKRALEAAEQIPFRSCVLHLGLKDDRWSTESLDLSLTAIEHLKAFATPLGVQLLLENLSNDLATPAHLVEIARVGHFNTLGFCLDTGHAHLSQPMLPDESGYNRSAREQLREQWGDAALKDALPEAFQVFGDRLVETHLHDNAGSRDEHLWPSQLPGNASGKGIDWAIPRLSLAHATQPVNNVLEIAFEPATPLDTISRQLASARRLLEIQPLA